MMIEQMHLHNVNIMSTHDDRTACGVALTTRTVTGPGMQWVYHAHTQMKLEGLPEGPPEGQEASTHSLRSQAQNA